MVEEHELQERGTNRSKCFGDNATHTVAATGAEVRVGDGSRGHLTAVSDGYIGNKISRII